MEIDIFYEKKQERCSPISRSQGPYRKQNGKEYISSNSTKNWTRTWTHNSKKVKRVLESEGMSSLCVFSYDLIRYKDFKENVAAFRRKCQRIAKNRLVFIDGTGMRSEPRKLRAISPRGTTPRVRAEKHEKYEPRVDMWGAITYSGPLVCETLASKQRKKVTNNSKTKKKGVTQNP